MASYCFADDSSTAINHLQPTPDSSHFEVHCGGSW